MEHRKPAMRGLGRRMGLARKIWTRLGPYQNETGCKAGGALLAYASRTWTTERPAHEGALQLDAGRDRRLYRLRAGGRGRRVGDRRGLQLPAAALLHASATA